MNEEAVGGPAVEAARGAASRITITAGGAGVAAVLKDVGGLEDVGGDGSVRRVQLGLMSLRDVGGLEDVGGDGSVRRVQPGLTSRWGTGAWAPWARCVDARWEMMRRWWAASAAWSGGGSVAKISAKMWSWGPLAVCAAGGARTVKTTSRLGGMVGRLRW
jgi:hypothetical protein